MMQRLNLIGCIFCAFALLFASCEQSELTSIEQAPVQELGLIKVESDRATTQETTPVVEYPLVMQPYDGSSKNTLRLVENIEKDRGSTKPRTRAGENSSNNAAAKSSCYSKYLLGCNVTQLRSSTEEDSRSYLPETQDANDADFYDNMGFNISLSGNEKAFYIEVTRETYYQITISGHQKQLAMILLETNLLNCFEENQNVETTEEYTKVAAYKNVTAGRTTTLGPVRLTPGFYTLVIDSYRNGGTSFFVSTKCTTYSSSNSCGSGTIVFDDFARYTENIGISEQSSYWEKWNPEAAYDGIISYCSACSASSETQRFTRTLNVARQPTNSSSQPNVLLPLGERFDGRYELNFELGVKSGKSGFFSLQNVLTNGNESNEEGAKFYFREFGYGEVKVAGRTIAFNYLNGYWQKVKLDFDFVNGTIKFYLQDKFIGQWKTTDEFSSQFGSGQVEGVQFYPYYSNSDYLVEGVCFRSY